MDRRFARGEAAGLAAVLALGLLVRLAHLWCVHDRPFIGQLVMDSREYDRWARQIAGGDWLGSGAFFQAPLYPYLVGLIYALGGTFPVVVYGAQIAASLGGLVALERAGRRLAGAATGLAAAGLAACAGPLVFYDVQLLKTSFAVTAVALLLWSLVAAWQGGRALLWFVAGALLGLLGELRENALALLPVVVALPWLRRELSARRRLVASALAAIGVLVVLAPVAVRNARLGGGFLPTTFQGGVNFYIGNHAGADGTYQPLSPGRQVPRLERQESVRLAERARGRKLTPAEVSRFWLARAGAWIRGHPADFLRLTLHKLRLFWSFYEQPDAVDYYALRQGSPPLRLAGVEWGGVALLAAAGLYLERRRLSAWVPVLAVVAVWTLSVVLFFVFSRYRLPAFPALALLAGVPLAHVVRAARSGRPRRAIAGATACVVALAVPHLLGYAPRRDLVESNLGRLAEERGADDEAAGHYRAALAAAPGDLLATLGLGNLAARGGRYEAARGWFRRAVELAPASVEAWNDLGGAELALGNRSAARAALDRALELDPQDAAALHNRLRLALAAGEGEQAHDLARRLLEVAPEGSSSRRLAAAVLGTVPPPPRR